MLILWIQFRIGSFRILSISLYSDLFYPNLSVIILEMGSFRRDSKQFITASGLLRFATPEALGSCLTILFLLKSSNQLFLVSGSQEYLNILPICAKNALNRLLKWTKNLQKIAPATDCLSTLKALKVFHRLLTPPFVLHVSNLGLEVLGCYPLVYILPFCVKNCP